MDVDIDADTFIASALSRPDIPEALKPFYQRFQSLHSKKLYYQLTQSIQSFLAQPESAPFQLELFHSFIADFSSKLPQLRLVAIGVTVARQYGEAKEALAFLKALTEKVDKPETKDAFVLGTMEAAHYKLVEGDMDGTAESMSACEKILDQLDSVEPVVNAAFYRVSGDYHKFKAEYADYYKTSLLFLACVNVDTDLGPDERVERAHDLGISALLGSIYNFGELLMHPILDSLNGTPHEWIKALLFAFNAGDIGKFESLQPQLAAEQLLLDSTAFLREKIRLMALIEAVFKRPTTDRVIPFSVVAAETKLVTEEVEYLIMKALSLKLIRGTMDQVSGTTSITWVQPRVLDKTQIAGLRDRLAEWSDQVKAVEGFASSQAPELLIGA